MHIFHLEIWTEEEEEEISGYIAAVSYAFPTRRPVLVVKISVKYTGRWGHFIIERDIIWLNNVEKTIIKLFCYAFILNSSANYSS